MHFMLPQFADVVSKAFSLGGAGVHVFIHCNGFGLYLSHLRKPLSYADFIKRRMLKVYLPYLFIIIVSFFYFGHSVSSYDWSLLGSHVFQYKMFIERYENSWGQMWFVSTIIQFYLCWPLIVFFSKKKIFTPHSLNNQLIMGNWGLYAWKG